MQSPSKSWVLNQDPCRGSRKSMYVIQVNFYTINSILISSMNYLMNNKSSKKIRMVKGSMKTIMGSAEQKRFRTTDLEEDWRCCTFFSAFSERLFWTEHTWSSSSSDRLKNGSWPKKAKSLSNKFLEITSNRLTTSI